MPQLLVSCLIALSISLLVGSHNSRHIRAQSTGLPGPSSPSVIDSQFEVPENRQIRIGPKIQ